MDWHTLLSRTLTAHRHVYRTRALTMKRLRKRWQRDRPARADMRAFVANYTKDLTAEDLSRVFTRDTPEAYHFFARHIDFGETEGLAWHRRLLRRARLFFVAFTMRLSPARRVLYGASLLLALIGFLQLPSGAGIPEGTQALVAAFIILNLLVLLEVADRLSLKNDLEDRARHPAGHAAARPAPHGRRRNRWLQPPRQHRRW